MFWKTTHLDLAVVLTVAFGLGNLVPVEIYLI